MKEWANPYLGCHPPRHVSSILYMNVQLAKLQTGAVANQQAKQIKYAELAATPHICTYSHQEHECNWNGGTSILY